MKKNSLRDEMPNVAAFIDDLREVFGKEMIDGQIRKGMRGEPVFWASENGHEIGTPVDSGATTEVTWNEKGIAVATEIERGPDGKRIGKTAG